MSLGIADVDEADLDLVGGNRLEGERAAGEGKDERQGKAPEQTLFFIDSSLHISFLNEKGEHFRQNG